VVEAPSSPQDEQLATFTGLNPPAAANAAFTCATVLVLTWHMGSHSLPRAAQAVSQLAPCVPTVQDPHTPGDGVGRREGLTDGDDGTRDGDADGKDGTADGTVEGLPTTQIDPMRVPSVTAP